MVLNRILILVGSGLFFNSAYSIYFERIVLHSGATWEYTPSTKLISQMGISFILLIIGTILSSPPLKDIHWKTQLKQRSIDEFDAKMGFINLNNRGHLLYGTS
ncbi:hypothetical protein CROQUDRAFT_70240 [Cronartium quercuum f. sp. fusiforme G11]|uniref:Uncharacterized protein n=1 Tax=Cronartium quercuum f. sp. fusiforme G11 TaxID=708437 RepID=A0A9P6N7R5_9BASI|nr:hypothetical protein CROQUDRAFT_70240 [Cronartium quercuum f. sp. fusiforme G11]